MARAAPGGLIQVKPAAMEMAYGAAMGAYVCPMHPDIRLPDGGKCPRCGMALVPEGTSFALLRHLASNPVMLAVMFGAMFAVMAAVMMLMR